MYITSVILQNLTDLNFKYLVFVNLKFVLKCFRYGAPSQSGYQPVFIRVKGHPVQLMFYPNIDV